ncbi:poly-gamma-glutamate synthesis protein (capsule biosynthesis protein) [Pontibacter aydingkolensis]|uniref:CapA family protein n=1 Tax=Pontibacter aydingkolensis TaxID=1911536 RepID=A0ABS7CY13_9BACT|nr:CapA family protein [Pontibacter aydingkolensis]MBW7468731.1 CapA family protein [Pontibacter aydingkolensis]
MISKIAILSLTFALLAVDQQADIKAMRNNAHDFVPQDTAAALTLFLCGDVMTGRGIDQVLQHSVDPEIHESYVKDARDYVRLAERKNGTIPKQVSYDYIWGDALEVWRRESPGLKIINLETSITNHNTPWPGKVVQYRMHPANVPVLTAAGVDFCSLANNHTLDWGRPGLAETIKTLSEAGVPFAGAGLNLNEARKPAIFKKRQGRIIVLAYGSQNSGISPDWAAARDLPGINLLPDMGESTVKMVQQQVKEIKQQGDVVVFTVHWGSNWGYDVPPSHQYFACQLIDKAGVDLVHGHSSHHPMGMEVYKGKLIMYGAGDFINDYEGIGGHEMYRGDLTLMYFPNIDPVTGQLKSLKMVPMQVRKFKLNYASTSDTKWLQGTLNRECNKLGTSVKLNQDGSFFLSW